MKVSNIEKDKAIKLISEQINEIKNDYSKYGDLSEWVRTDLINTLLKIKQIIKRS